MLTIAESFFIAMVGRQWTLQFLCWKAELVPWDVYMYMNLVLVYIVSPQHEGQTKGCKLKLTSPLWYTKREGLYEVTVQALLILTIVFCTSERWINQ